MSQNREILKISNIVKTFNVKVSLLGKKYVHALNDISLTVTEGQTLSLVGESGCGKTTLGKVIAGLYKIDNGKIIFNNEDISDKDAVKRGTIQKNIQMIFQDPYASLNPRKKIYKILEQPLKRFMNLNSEERYEKIVETCENVGIDLSYLHRYPHQFSGGQRQRIAIARAIILNPKLVIADEPISALDVSIQAQILNLMMDLQEKLSLTYLFITHDISVVKHISDYVAVMYLGEIVEYGRKDCLFKNPLHPYTKLLFSAVPDINKPFLNESILESGEIPSPMDLPKGCFFASRCPLKDKRCMKEHPELIEIENNYFVRCFKVTDNFN
jgi:oligopeptide/dipeptide ABC transporter ATP-binding protein